MTAHRTQLRFALQLVRWSAALLPLVGWAEVGLSQVPAGLPVEVDLPVEIDLPVETVPSIEPVLPPSPAPALQVPALVTPSLPGLRDAAHYLPQDQTIHLVLKLGQRKVYVYQGQQILASYPVAVGRPEFPTPTGEFEIFEMVVNPAWQNPWTGEVETPGIDGSLGLRWIGFTKMPNGVIGFHGTPSVASIGQAASHGCVRMRNEDIVKLYEHVKVGTLVRVES